MSRKDLANPTFFEKRTLVVWAALVMSMTLVSGLLLMLEPSPHAPAVGPVLAVLDTSPRSIQSLFVSDPAPEPSRWQAIVIHHSAQTHGNAESLGKLHQAQGAGGLRYHFVIGNGDGTENGEIQAGYRWLQQLDAPHAIGADSAPWFNHHAIAICLIGDGDKKAPTQAQMEQLVRLVVAMQQRLGIPAERVYLHANIADTTSPGLHFPTSWFRQQLADVDLIQASGR